MEQVRAKQMATNRLDGILRHLRCAVRPPGSADTDARLLDQYVRHRDESAFESLVRRHGPMVFGVCRRVLANDQDAEDAFQATFLVLVRKAASIGRPGALGPWLYGVAYRTALEARRARAKRRAKEAMAVARPDAAAESGEDLREVLDRELAALPERYRAAVILCDLQGKERKEAARELGCPEGTVASRLARGRSLLAKRLAPYGLATGALAALSREAVPAELVSSTVRAAALYGAGAAGAVSANVLSLTERMVRVMLVAKLRVLAVVVLLIGVVGTGAGWAYHHGAAAAQPAQPGAAEKSELEEVRGELKLLERSLQDARDQARLLHEKLNRMGQEREEVLYQGKPAAHWVKLLQDRDPSYRKNALQALGGIAKVDPNVVPVVAGSLGDDDADVVQAAVIELADLGNAAVPYLITAVKRPGQQNRMAVIVGLRSFGKGAEPAVPALLGVLKNGNQQERLEAAATLGSIGPGARAAVPALIDLLKGREKWLRWPADVGLGGIGPEAKAAVPALTELLKSQDDNDRHSATVALGNIGPAAKSAIPTLLDIVEQPQLGPLHDKAAEAIEKIDPEAAAKLKRP